MAVYNAGGGGGGGTIDSLAMLRPDNYVWTNTSDATTTGLNVRWYGTSDKFPGQPQQYGYLTTFGTQSEAHQLWINQPNGRLYHRGTNSTTASNPPAFVQLWQNGDAITGAVWNDYAEYRIADTIEPGYVLMEKGDDTLTKTIERLSHFAGITSDTWGFAQGETDSAKTPIAVSGRVLVYPYQDRDNYKPGDCVCAAPDGTVDLMTVEEVVRYPDRIVGTVSCVPDYEEWGGGENADRDPVQINGRIWVKVK